MNPITKFKNWYELETERTTVSVPSACCLSSIGLDGYPNARFVSLKEIIGDAFMITGPITSRKGMELLNNPKASLVFWWTETERQVRIQGTAAQIDDDLADAYFKERNKASQLVSHISKQGESIEDPESFRQLFEEQEAGFRQREIPRPNNWSGFAITPTRIEFLEFKESRLHHRELFERVKESWKSTFLQP